MIQPTTAYIVTKGTYDGYRWIAVFTEREGAREFADHHNLVGIFSSADDKAAVEEIDLYGAGWRRPRGAATEVIDGEVVQGGLLELGH